MERSSVSRLVEELVKKEFIDRVQNENNRREVLLTITEKGTKTIEQVRKQSIHYYQSILNDLSEEEQETILKGFQTFTKSLQKNTRRQTHDKHEKKQVSNSILSFFCYRFLRLHIIGFIWEY